MNPSETPAVVGVGQIVQRPGDVPLSDTLGPIELMAEAARLAAADSGVTDVLRRVQWIGVARGLSAVRDPGSLVADRIGVTDPATALSGLSGTSPQDLLAIAAARIAAGQLDVALVLGGEARWSQQQMKRRGIVREPLTERGDGVPESVGDYPEAMTTELIRLGGPAALYAIFEDRLRVTREQSIARHQDEIARLWARFSDVASANPYAWDRTAHTPHQIAEVGQSNRMIAFPYPKSMVANNTVDMASAILLCSAHVARQIGVPADRMVFPHVVATSHETWEVVERRRLDSSPALAAAAGASLEYVHRSIDEIDHIDLYACFPSIVQMSCAALGLDHRDDRPLTVTGGLGFAAAPIANAVGHSIATVVERVRGGGLGLVHANGGAATKHSFAVYGDRPGTGFVHLDVQDRVDLEPRTPIAPDWSGPVTIEAATLLYDREGPTRLLAAVVDGDERRGWATSGDPDLFEAVTTVGIAGSAATRLQDGTLQR